SEFTRIPLPVFIINDAAPRLLLSFPTRRSSDLSGEQADPLALGKVEGHIPFCVEHGRHEQVRAEHVLAVQVWHREVVGELEQHGDRKSTRLNSSHVKSSYAVFCLKKKNI